MSRIKTSSKTIAPAPMTASSLKIDKIKVCGYYTLLLVVFCIASVPATRYVVQYVTSFPGNQSNNTITMAMENRIDANPAISPWRYSDPGAYSAAGGAG